MDRSRSSGIYYSTFGPKLGLMRVENNLPGIKELYFRSILILLLTFVVFGMMMAFLILKVAVMLNVLI